MRGKIGIGHFSRFSLCCNGLVKYLPHGCEDVAESLVIKVPNSCFRMQPLLEEYLIRIDIADAGNVLLIHEGRLQHVPAAGKEFDELPFGSRTL